MPRRNTYETEYEESLENSRASADEEPKRSEVSKIGKVSNTQYARVRKIPSSSSMIMAVLEEGDKVEIVQTQREIVGYYKVRLDDGRIGYISSQYLKEV